MVSCALVGGALDRWAGSVAGNEDLGVGNWKLQRHDSKKTNNYQVNKLLGGQRGQKVPQYALFDLSKDPAEKKDMSQKNPKIFAKMKAELQKFLDDGRSR